MTPKTIALTALKFNCVVILKIRTPRNCNHPKIEIVLFYYTVIGPKDADGMANSVDPDQTAPLRALFAQACLSENSET